MTFGLSLNLFGSTTKALEIDKVYDILIVGGGPAGLNAALYAKRKGGDVGIITKIVGGQIVDTSIIENYLGYASITGKDLVKQFEDHVAGLEIPIAKEVIVEKIQIDEGSNIKRLTTSDKKTYMAKSVIVATGSVPRKLEVPGEEEFFSKGVHYCAICDGPLYTNKEIIVAGGGNTAVEAAIDLSKFASKVTIVHRSQIRADKILTDRLEKLSNVEVKLETQIKRILGDTRFSGVEVLDKAKNQLYTIEAEGIFVEIGVLPNTQGFGDLLELNVTNEIIVDKKGRTNIPGIYAAGDCTDVEYKQVIISAADGANVALSVFEYLNTLDD